VFIKKLCLKPFRTALEGFTMKKTTDYLDDAKKTLGIDSDYAMAQFLGVTRMAVSSYRAGKRIIDDYAAAKIAGVLGIDPMIVIAAANAEREKTVERKDYWRNFYERLGGMAASVAVAGCIVTAWPTNADASTISTISKVGELTAHYAQLIRRFLSRLFSRQPSSFAFALP
jgi:plasmid maintenance system antidote protein VapI